MELSPLYVLKRILKLRPLLRREVRSPFCPWDACSDTLSNVSVPWQATVVVKKKYIQSSLLTFFFFSVPVCAITASGVPGGTFVSMNRFSTLCG
jgi:hypothetical protein